MKHSMRSMAVLLIAALLLPLLASSSAAQERRADQLVDDGTTVAAPGPAQKLAEPVAVPGVPADDGGGGPVAIVGGDDVLPGTYPFMVSLQVTEQRQRPATLWDPNWSEWSETNPADELVGHRCGATLIAPQWVMTAAHCVDQTSNIFGFMVRRQYRFDALIGPTVLTVDGPVVERIPVVQSYTHPNWSTWFNQVTAGNDIALLRLEYPASATPVALRDVNPMAETLSMLVGWGWTGWTPGSSATDHLQQASVPMVDPSSCSNTAGTICFSNGDPDNQQGSCIGDSGGPSLIWNAGTATWEQTGISSFAVGACVGTSVYTHVGTHWVWILCRTGVLVIQTPPPWALPC